MPKSSTHILRRSEEKQIYELLTDGDPQEYFRSEEGDSWRHWLEAHTSFSFQGQRGRMSVIKESHPRGMGYWYAYRLIVVLALLFRDVHLYPLLKLALASLIGVPLCFACGYLVRRLPPLHTKYCDFRLCYVLAGRIISI